MIERHYKRRRCIQYKGEHCAACGIKYDNTNGSIFDFHHLNEKEKEFTISNVVGNKKITWDMLKKELDKCIMLCSNCHRLEHSSEY